LPHFLDSPLDYGRGFAAYIVKVVQLFEIPADRVIFVVVLCIENSVGVGFSFDLFDALELAGQLFIDLIIGVIDGLFPDGVDFIDCVVDRRVLNDFMRKMLARGLLLLLHN